MFEDTILLVMTDGRDDYLKETMASAQKNLPSLQTYIHDDGGDEAHRELLRQTYPEATVVGGERSGFAGAIKRAWESIPECKWVFHLEDDFTFNEPVDLAGMVKVMKRFPYLVQIALLRQPWSGPEIQYGGVIGLNPPSYEDKSFEGVNWTEHRNFFTTNPSLYSYEIVRRGWPQLEFSEPIMAAQVLKDPEARSAYYGSKKDGPRVFHIGRNRSVDGEGY